MTDWDYYLYNVADEIDKGKRGRSQKPFDELREAVVNADEQMMAEIREYASSHSGRVVKTRHPNMMSVNMTKSFPRVGAAIALAYIGKKAANDLEALIIDEPVPLVAGKMMEEVYELDLPWFEGVLKGVSKRGGNHIAKTAEMYLRKLSGTTIAPPEKTSSPSKGKDGGIGKMLKRLANWYIDRQVRKHRGK